MSRLRSGGAGVNMANLTMVEVGMTRADVVAIMGEPRRQEVHGATEFLMYPSGRSETAALDFIPVATVDGRVTGIGRTLYDTVVRAKTNADLSNSQHQ
jgi:SmpA / OmlA family